MCLLSGKCFWPSAWLLSRAETSLATGTPVPFHAVGLLLAAAARGIGIEGASWGKPEPRFEPLTQGSGALIERENDCPQVADQRTKHLACSGRTMGQQPITWGDHLRQPPLTSGWLRQGARRHWQRAASNDAQRGWGLAQANFADPAGERCDRRRRGSWTFPGREWLDVALGSHSSVCE